MEIDTDSDKHYEGSGVGRVQKYGAPPQICLSSGFGDHPSYVTDGKNRHSLSLCASAKVDGKWYLGGEHPHTIPEDCFYAKDDRCLAYMEWDAEGNKVCQSVVVKEDGVETRAEVFGDKAGMVGIEIPAFAFDGVEETKICVTEQELTVEYNGYICRYTTTSKIVDLGEDICNRNGKYHRYRAEDDRYLVAVKIEIEKI